METPEQFVKSVQIVIDLILVSLLLTVFLLLSSNKLMPAGLVFQSCVNHASKRLKV